MANPIEDIIGDYRAFAAQQRDLLLAPGVDISSYELSHLAYRVSDWADEYVRVRSLLERHAVANGALIELIPFISASARIGH